MSDFFSAQCINKIFSYLHLWLLLHTVITCMYAYVLIYISNTYVECYHTFSAKAIWYRGQLYSVGQWVLVHWAADALSKSHTFWTQVRVNSQMHYFSIASLCHLFCSLKNIPDPKWKYTKKNKMKNPSGKTTQRCKGKSWVRLKV